MARYLGPSCRLCRAQKQKLMLKGDRCLSIKCPIDKKDNLKRKGLPGKAASARLKKISNYGIQLKEKQKLKNIYGILERQFFKYFKIANKKKGITGENLITILETRLDNIIYRMHFASSRTQARQFIKHGHIEVNGKIVNIPSFNVKKDDVIAVKDKSKKLKQILESLKRVGSDGVVPWLEVNPDDVKGTIKQIPRRNEIKDLENINEQLIVELYSK
ncbi:MAG: 30S ribosomal protein S4 [Fusobacteriaceae bacterium]|nr:30S ribosomal protein S4 [Fusobacteriaceae bacterium]